MIHIGGAVKFNRVDGDLALSRAIGDTRFKQDRTRTPEKQKISCVPTITRKICNSGDYLLLFCDGIVEQRNNQDVFAFTLDSIKKNIIDKDKDSNNMDQDDQDIDIKDPPHLNIERDKQTLENTTIRQYLRDEEINYLTQNEKLGLVPKHTAELRRVEKVVLDLTEWAIQTGSKDNMTAILVKIGKTNINNLIYQRIWSPCEWYQYKIQFNSFGEVVREKDKLTLDRFMRLFELDCANTGWNLTDDYQNALLQKILYINDLITNDEQKIKIKEHIQIETNQLIKIEQLKRRRRRQRTSISSTSTSISTSRGTKRRAPEGDDIDIDEDNEDDEDDDDDDDELGTEIGSPRKRRKLSE